MPIIYYLLGSVLSVYILWILYLAVMHLSKAKKAGTLTKTTLVLGTPVLLLGWFVDFLVNVFVMSLILLEPPKELTVTSRLKRHHKESSGWRLKVVLFFEPILDPFDPEGDHI